MRIFKNKVFNKWAEKEGLSDDTLRAAVDEIARSDLRRPWWSCGEKTRGCWWSRQEWWCSHPAGVEVW